jgi:hypothetical protein
MAAQGRLRYANPPCPAGLFSVGVRWAHPSLRGLERFLFSYLHDLKLFLDSGFRRNDDIFPAFAKTPSSRRKPGPSSWIKLFASMDR